MLLHLEEYLVKLHLSTKTHCKYPHRLYQLVLLYWFVYIFTVMLDFLLKVGHNFQKSSRHLDICRTSLESPRERSSTCFWWVVWFNKPSIHICIDSASQTGCPCSYSSDCLEIISWTFWVIMQINLIFDLLHSMETLMQAVYTC